MLNLIKKASIQYTALWVISFPLVAMDPLQLETTIISTANVNESTGSGRPVTTYNAEIFSSLKAICESRIDYNLKLSRACSQWVEMTKLGNRATPEIRKTVREKIIKMGGHFVLNQSLNFVKSAHNDAQDYEGLLSYISDIEKYQNNADKFQDAVEYLELRLRTLEKKTPSGSGNVFETLVPDECKESNFISLCLGIIEPYHSERVHSVSILIELAEDDKDEENINWGINFTKIANRTKSSSDLLKSIRQAITGAAIECGSSTEPDVIIRNLTESIDNIQRYSEILNGVAIQRTRESWKIDNKKQFSKFYESMVKEAFNFYKESDLKNIKFICESFMNNGENEQSPLTSSRLQALQEIQEAINTVIQEERDEKKQICDLYRSKGRIYFEATDPRNESLKIQASSVETSTNEEKKDLSKKKKKARILKEKKRNNKAASKDPTLKTSDTVEEITDTITALSIEPTVQETKSDSDNESNDGDAQNKDSKSSLAQSSVQAAVIPEGIRRSTQRKPRQRTDTIERRTVPYCKESIFSILDRQDCGLLPTLEALEEKLIKFGWSARYFITQRSGRDLSYAFIYARPDERPVSLTGYNHGDYKTNLRSAFEDIS